MKVLICGGRDWGDRPREERVRAWNWLKTLGITHVVHGGASGADKFAGLFASHHGIPCTEHPADWVKNGRTAGFIRNQEMLDKHQDIGAVIALPGGNGTADMVRRAEKKGIMVIEYGQARV